MQSTVRTGFVVALLVVFFVGFGLVVFFVRADKSATKVPSTNNANAPQMRLYTESVDTSFAVPKLGHKAYNFAVPSGAKDAILRGHFSATGGSGNDIEVWVLSGDGFVNWQNNHPVKPVYNSGRVTQATVNISLPGTGTYYLVFNNHFSLLSPKAVQDNLTLTYQH